MASGKHRRKWCILCKERAPVYAFQSYRAGGRPVTYKTVQVNTQPIVCGVCEMQLTPAIIFNNYAALREFLVEHARDEKPPHVLYRSHRNDRIHKR